MTAEKVGITAMLQEEAVWCLWFEKAGNKQISPLSCLRGRTRHSRSESSGPKGASWRFAVSSSASTVTPPKT
ncbi:hypothetical protein [Bradyrhizobium sp. USDA 4451]